MRRMLAAAVLAAVYVCAALPGVCGDESAAVRAAYEGYRKAFLSGKPEELKKYLVPERAKNLDVPGAESGLAMAAALLPKDIVVSSVSVDGTSARILASGKDPGGGVSNGRIDLRKVKGKWLLYAEHWESGSSASSGTAQDRGTAAPKGAFSEMRGMWLGREYGTDVAWRLEVTGIGGFRSSSSAGEWHSGTLVFPKSGVPGPVHGRPVDAGILQSSDRSVVGKVSFGVFYVGDGTLYLCGGKPGGAERLTDWNAPPPGFRCFAFEREQAVR